MQILYVSSLVSPTKLLYRWLFFSPWTATSFLGKECFLFPPPSCYVVYCQCLLPLLWETCLCRGLLNSLSPALGSPWPLFSFYSALAALSPAKCQQEAYPHCWSRLICSSTESLVHWVAFYCVLKLTYLLSWKGISREGGKRKKLNTPLM